MQSDDHCDRQRFISGTARANYRNDDRSLVSIGGYWFLWWEYKGQMCVTWNGFIWVEPFLSTKTTLKVVFVDIKCSTHAIELLVCWYQEHPPCIKWDKMTIHVLLRWNKSGLDSLTIIYRMCRMYGSQKLRSVLVEWCLNGKVIIICILQMTLCLLLSSSHVEYKN